MAISETSFEVRMMGGSQNSYFHEIYGRYGKKKRYKVKALEIYMTIILWQCNVAICKFSYEAFCCWFCILLFPIILCKFCKMFQFIFVPDHMFVNFANYCFQILFTNLANCHFAYFLQIVVSEFVLQIVVLDYFLFWANLANCFFFVNFSNCCCW